VEQDEIHDVWVIALLKYMFGRTTIAQKRLLRLLDEDNRAIIHVVRGRKHSIQFQTRSRKLSLRLPIISVVALVRDGYLAPMRKVDWLRATTFDLKLTQKGQRYIRAVDTGAELPRPSSPIAAWWDMIWWRAFIALIATLVFDVLGFILQVHRRVGFNIIYASFTAVHRFVPTLYLTITAVTLASDARLPTCGAVQSAMHRCSTTVSVAG